MKLARATVIAITTLGMGLGGCDGGGGQAGPDGPLPDGPVTDGPVDAPIDAPDLDAPDLDAPDIDAPDLDGPDIDAPTIDAPIIDAPIDAIVTDAPVDALVTDAPIDAPIPTIAELSLSVTGSGAGVVYNEPLSQWCANQVCDAPFTRQTLNTYTFRQQPIAGSTFTGWSGCTPQPDGSCTVFLEHDTLVTATYDAPPSVTWVRSAWPLYISDYPIFLDATTDGVVATGTGRDYVDGGPWIARYLSDGTQLSDGIVSIAPLLHRAVAHGVNLAGTHWFLVAEPPPPSPPGLPERLVLRRVTPPAVAVSPGGNVGIHGLAVDATGNVYVSGISGGSTYLASYDAAGVERWRITPTGGPPIFALVIRGDLLVAGGTGWIGTYDLAGAPGWARTISPMTGGPPTIAALAVDSDGDVIYGGVDTSTTSYVAGALRADGISELWQARFASRSAGTLALRADDSIRLWLGNLGAVPAPSVLLDLTEDGVQTASQNVAALPTPSAIVIDASGVTYLAGPHRGQDYVGRRPAILRHP